MTTQLDIGNEYEGKENVFSSGEVTHGSVTAQVKLALETILRQIEKVCRFLARRKHSDIPGTSKANGSQPVDTTASSLDNRYYLMAELT